MVSSHNLPDIELGYSLKKTHGALQKVISYKIPNYFQEFLGFKQNMRNISQVGAPRAKTGNHVKRQVN